MKNKSALTSNINPERFDPLVLSLGCAFVDHYFTGDSADRGYIRYSGYSDSSLEQESVIK